MRQICALFPMVQRYKFESKSQRNAGTASNAGSCFQWFKDTNLKVNHNGAARHMRLFWLFPMVQRYKFESKSQQRNERMTGQAGCFQWFKDTNLKVNHNLPLMLLHSVRLFPMVQRYKFESKSQLTSSPFGSAGVVSNGSKIQI